MKLIKGTRLELVRCPGCHFEQILHGPQCSRCRTYVEELFDDGAGG